MIELIVIKKLRALPVFTKGKSNNKNLALTFNAELMRLGFVMSKDLFELVSSLDVASIEDLYKKCVPILKKMKGDDVKYKPLYPNFPKQVMEASYLELYLNAILHYWTFGQWKPNYEELPREIAFEDSKFISLDTCKFQDVVNTFGALMGSNTSLSQEDKYIVEWFLSSDLKLPFPKDGIPFKETLCMVAASAIKRGETSRFKSIVKTPTDVLRVITHLSGGDISLSESTKFKSLPNKTRRLFCDSLEGMLKFESAEGDFVRHKSKWIKAFHSLHVGDYKNRYVKTFEIAQVLRNGTWGNKNKIVTYGYQVEKYLAENNINSLIPILKERPGEFARRLDHVLRISHAAQHPSVIDSFAQVAPKVSTRVLLQVGAHIKSRSDDFTRVAFPKGNMQAAQILKSQTPFGKITTNLVDVAVRDALVEKFSKLEALGNVWIDPELKGCPVPMQQRSASTGLFQVARGTRLPISDKDTLRLFIYWVGQDIDLSASLHNEDFKMLSHISYTNLKSEKYKACHSGDITSAPRGAAEFIDITIDGALKYGARYIVMNVFVFSGPTFSEHEACYAGWMTKDKPNAGDIFDPKLVEQKIDLRSTAKNAIPVVFDLKERKGIWCDLVTKRNTYGDAFNPLGNNVENNRASIGDTLKAILNLENKPNLYDLFALHGKARGTIVTDREKADTVFALDDGVTPFDINTISSDFMS